MKHISLLYKATAPESYADDILHGTGLDTFLSIICSDIVKRQLFSDVVSSILSDRDEIIYRQDILRDFLENPGLFESIRMISYEITELKESFIKHRREMMRNIKSNSTSSAYEPAKTQCCMSAMLLKNLLLEVKKLGDLKINKIRSDGLSELFDESKKVTETESFVRLLKLCGTLEYRSSSAPIDLRLKLNNSGCICSSELIEHRFPVTRPTRYSLFHKRTPPAVNDSHIEFIPGHNTMIDHLISSPFWDLTNEFDNAVRQLIDIYDSLYNDICFYEIAIRYCNYLKEKGVETVFPEISDISRADSLYDLNLITENPVSQIIPQNLPGFGSIIVYGANNCGKTVFLRSVAAAQILAQSGLPIPAKRASIKIYKKIKTLYAGSYNENMNSDMGDFEKEARILSEIIDSDLSKTFILMNEWFQTTSYTEGAAGLFCILEYFQKIGVDFIVVTHMIDQLTTYFHNQEEDIVKMRDILFMKFDNGYKSSFISRDDADICDK